MSDARTPPARGTFTGVYLGARDPRRVTISDVDAAVLESSGMGALSERLWREGARVSDDARRSVNRHLRTRFGARAPHRGTIMMATFVLLLLAVLPIGLLNGIRLGLGDTTFLAGAVSAAVGVAELIVIAAAGRRPLARPVALQSTILAALLSVAAGVGAFLTDGFGLVLLIGGASAAILAAVTVRIVRARGGDATAQIDDAVEIAHLDVAAEVDRARQGLGRDLADAMATRDDVAELRARRSQVIAELRALGNPVEDSAPDALPGHFVIQAQTSLWLPLDQR